MSRQASAMHSRPIRPSGISRKSQVPAGVPSVIYSQPAADFRPLPDYIGPNKARMQRRPEPSMNPKKFSLPILSVSKLDVTTSTPQPSNTTLPLVKPAKKGKFKGVSSTFLHCNQAQNMLQLMPTAFQKQFRPELKKKRPIIGRVKRFVHRDFHEPPPPDHVALQGILLLGGSHRIKIDEGPREPGTPPPRSGRRHLTCQTDTYLEDIADNETGFFSVAIQCDPVHDEPLDAPDLYFTHDKQIRHTLGTQLNQWTFPEVDRVFDELAVNLAETVIMESLKQLQEEHELEALRKQQENHTCLRNRELEILAKYKAAHRKYEEQKRLVEARKPWDQTLDQIIQLVGFDKIKDSAPPHYVAAIEDKAILELINETVVPHINDDVTPKVESRLVSRKVLDELIETTVAIREAEYAGEMFIGDQIRKGSLVTKTPSRHSLELEEWPGEYDELEDLMRQYSGDEADERESLDMDSRMYRFSN